MIKELFGISALALAVVQPAAAQDVSAEPNYETVQLNPGFSNDPYVVDVQSGGSVEASNIADACAGNISNAPDVRLRYGEGSGSLPLIIGAQSEYDTTLVVNAPDGSWYCDDDRGSGLNPLLRFERPMAGVYDIWIGTYSGTDFHPTKLVITELSSTLDDDYGNEASQPVGRLADSGGSGNAIYETVNLTSGFTPDPYIVRLQSGGGNAASDLSSECSGYIASTPDVELNYEAGSLPLYLSVDSMADTTLVVRAPNGRYFCDDDSGEGLNPRVLLQVPDSGRYQIWVGTYGDSELHTAELNISELYSQ